MVRKKYETVADRANEKLFEDLLSDQFGATVHKVPVSYAVDYLVLPRHGTPVWVEFKRRNHTYGTYDDVILSALKWWHATSLASRTGAKFAFVVQWDDRIGYVRYDPASPWSPILDWGGRTKATRDTSDIEPIVRLPIELFVRLGGTDGT